MGKSETISDVVVVGAGPGGLAAALEAARNSASVSLLEADSVLGGNAARSTGYIAFQDFAMQHEKGIVDSVENFMSDMQDEINRQSRRYGIIFDTELATVFAEESSNTYDFLCDIGFTFNRFLPRPEQHRTDRMVDVSSTSMFRDLFEKPLLENGVTIHRNTRALQLHTDEGAVRGVITDKEIFYASKGVVLATGGYQANFALRQRYQPEEAATTPYLGTKYDVGDGHLMGQAVGGDLINMTMIPELIMVGSAFVEDSIAINNQGERFHDEAGPYDKRVAALRNQPESQAWYIYDDPVATEKDALIAEMPSEAISAETVDQLAQKIGCEPAALHRTLSRWNETVESGTSIDPDYGRVIFPDPRRAIAEPPLYAVPMHIGINFPAGGFRTTKQANVINVFGQPIPGLYAVGDCAGGINPTIGLGGMRISAALTLGRIAGQAIAAGRKEETNNISGVQGKGADESSLKILPFG